MQLSEHVYMYMFQLCCLIHVVATMPVAIEIACDFLYLVYICWLTLP